MASLNEYRPEALVNGQRIDPREFRDDPDRFIPMAKGLRKEPSVGAVAMVESGGIVDAPVRDNVIPRMHSDHAGDVSKDRR